MGDPSTARLRKPPLTGPPDLAPRRTHEVCGAGADAFAAAQAGLRAGPLFWILPPSASSAAPGRKPASGRPDAYGLARFFDPGRLILVETRREEEIYWAMEECLRSGAAPFVIAEAPAQGPLAAADLTRSRRLQLAAEAGGGTGLLLIRARAAAISNAAETRWRAEPAPAWRNGADAGGGADAPIWEWRLLKNKRGPLGCWRLRWLGRRAAEGDPGHDRGTGGGQDASGPADAEGAAGAAHPLALVAESGGGARAAA